MYLIYIHNIYSKYKLIAELFPFTSFLDRRQRGPKRSVLLVIIGWLVGW